MFQRSVAGHLRATLPVEDRYISVVAKPNRRLSSTCGASMVAEAIHKTISAPTVHPRLHLKDLYTQVP
ncbi:hypothetical protein TNCV_3921561 [Trichonephila clavipes]|nr:hypothetical protein TNCV_3921561 [Trichonephila clavipes]